MSAQDNFDVVNSQLRPVTMPNSPAVKMIDDAQAMNDAFIASEAQRANTTQAAMLQTRRPAHFIGPMVEHLGRFHPSTATHPLVSHG